MKIVSSNEELIKIVKNLETIASKELDVYIAEIIRLQIDVILSVIIKINKFLMKAR
jgi:hypothetical protein